MSNRSLDPQPDSEMDSLLRRAAFVSTPLTAGGHSRSFSIGQTLLDGRLRIDRRIGEGGMGVVYEAYDEVRRGVVALKTLTRLDAQGIYALKLEFRSLADVSHPSLCRLFELFTEDDTWLFTMELVRGARFDRWVRPRGQLDEVRLRTVLPQLGDALSAIHQVGKLHRDLKGSNVLVTEEGRLVVLDFGLATDQSLGGVGQTVHDQRVCGTPAYMAPEQAAADVTTPASDYYAVGAMLFEALTGRQPFEGRVSEVMAAKQRQAAPAVHTLVAAAPDLAKLCDSLLDRDQTRRPGAPELRAVADTGERTISGVAAGDSPAWGRSASAHPRQAIVGREAELSQLASAFESTLLGRAVALFLTGESGMGKSALAAEFLDELRDEELAIVLAGRCYERESVPFKAFDAVLDDLSRHLRRLLPVEASALMPRDVCALAGLFPVLDRVEAVASSPKKEIPDVRERQQRAFAAFGELLGRMRDRRPVVVFIDDLQWTDRDSGMFMESLFAAAEPTPFLLIVGHRSEGAADNPLLQQALQAVRRNPAVDVRHVRVGPLTVGASRALAVRLAGTDFGGALAVASESRGSPFFVSELVRHAHDAATNGLSFTLEDAVMRHVQGLAPAARALLDVLAVAGRRLPLQLALAAAGAGHAAVDELSGERLLRTGGNGGRGSLASASSDRTVECYHDKIRETVFAALAPEALRTVHARLAAELSAAGIADPEHLALHFHGAGELETAAVHYQHAGEASMAALAFDAAGRQYQQALSLLGERATGALRVRLGYALASAGSSRAAAEMYRAACADAPSELALVYRCTAAYLLNTSGHLDEGRVLLGEVLEAIGLSLPRSRRTAIAGAVLARVQLWLRGLRLASASASPEEAAETNAYLRALWTVVQGALGNDPFVMVQMAGRYTRLALDAGSEGHAARALSLEAYLISFEGPATRVRSESLLGHAEKLATAVGEPEIAGWVQEMRGCVLVHEGRFAEARPLLGAAVECFETRCQGVPFELASGRGYDLNAANHLGQFAEISRKATHIVDNSLRRGDMYQASGVVGFAVQAWLAHQGLAFAEACLGEAKRYHEPQANYQWADYLLLVAEVDIALYRGDGAGGLGLIGAHWSAMMRSQLLRMRIADAMIQFCRGGCLLVASQQASSDGTASGGDLGLVRASVRSLKRSPLAYAPGWAAVLEAGLAQAKGRPEVAVASLRRAVACLDDAGLRMYAASARRRLGQLLLGDEGAALVAAGDAAMAAEGVSDKEATTGLLTPGVFVRG